MKYIKTIIGLALVAGMTFSAPEQTNAVDPITQAGKDFWGLLKSTMPNGASVYSPYAGYGINTSSGNQIAVMGLSIASTNGGGLILVGGHIGSRWVYGGGAFSYTRRDSLPVIGALLGETTESVGDGIIYDWKSHEPANYAFTAIGKQWDVGKKWYVGPTFSVASRSNVSGVDLVGVLKLSHSFK